MPTKKQKLAGNNDVGKLDSTPVREGSTQCAQSLVGSQDVMDLFDAKAKDWTHDPKHPEQREFLACPFWKHNPSRYRHVKNVCTSGTGFKDVGKLTEHIRRVHALRFGCEKCGLRFTKCRVEEVDDEKRRHVVHCTKPKVKLPDSEPEWMDKSQDENYRELNFQKDKGGPESCWHKICRALWGPDSKNAIEGAYNGAGFQLEVLRWDFMAGLRELAAQQPPRKESAHERSEASTSTAEPDSNLDPRLLSQQALQDLANGPAPFYRDSSRKDSGVYSMDQPGILKHPFDQNGDGVGFGDAPPLGNPDFCNDMQGQGAWAHDLDAFSNAHFASNYIDMDEDCLAYEVT